MRAQNGKLAQLRKGKVREILSEKEILLECLESVEKWSCHSEIANTGRKLGMRLWGDDTFI